MVDAVASLGNVDEVRERSFGVARVRVE